jgi:transposase
MSSEDTIIISQSEYKEFLELKARNSYLEHQLAQLRRLIFGSKRERFIPTDTGEGTGSLFDFQEEKPAEKPVEQITYTRSKSEAKKHPLRLELPAHLERRSEVIEPKNLPKDAEKIGEVITEVLEYEPAKIYVRQIIRPKYIVSSTDERTEIAVADLPTLPIPKGNAGASLLAHILISKFADHLPFYRQVQIFRRQGITLAESTINGWFNASCNLLEPLYQALKEKITASNYLMADETPIPVLTKDKPGATHKGYHWVYYDPVNRLVLFDYRKTRGREGPDELLKDFSGHLQTDGYAAYTSLKNKRITLLACMAHARRMFEHAKDNDPQRAEQALLKFQNLYDIEQEIRELNPSDEGVKTTRQKKSLPVLQELEAWLKEEGCKVLPQSAIGKAIAYSLNLWPRLIRYVEDGRFKIDNNLIENSIRPVALGRKNYLFAGSHDAAQQAAILYSLLAICKQNNVEPYAWLQHTLSIIQDYPANQLLNLLPTN